MYALGIVCVLVAAIMLKKTKTILRRGSSVRYGVTGIPHPVCQDRSYAHLGASVGLH